MWFLTYALHITTHPQFLKEHCCFQLQSCLHFFTLGAMALGSGLCLCAKQGGLIYPTPITTTIFQCLLIL